jgi:hypothetical protein
MALEFKKGGSYNLYALKERDTKSLLKYEKYQTIWQTQMNESEKVRNKLNLSAFCKTHKFNAQQAAKGDLTIIDRVDIEADKSKNQKLLTTLFRPSHSNGHNWQCSLRQWEHDNEWDGVSKLKEPPFLDSSS